MKFDIRQYRTKTAKAIFALTPIFSAILRQGSSQGIQPCVVTFPCLAKNLPRNRKNSLCGIAIKNAELYYGDFHALKGIDLAIPENRITAFIGPSGCGKSTLLKSLNRMNDLVEGCRITGKFLLDGEDIYGKMDVNLLRKRVGMVFQKPNPFPMSVYGNIAFGPRTHGIHSKVRLDDIVERSLRDPTDKRTEDYITGRFG